MPPAPPDPPRDDTRHEQRRYLYDMLEQLAAIAVACREKEVADMLYALVAVYGERDGESDEDEDDSTASN